MNDEVIIRPSREDFISFINEQLIGLGFSKESEVEVWGCEKDIQSGGGTIIINGQRHDQPGETHHLRFEVEVFGDGEMKDVDTCEIDQFIEINFNIYQDKISVSEHPTFCLFFNDNDLFNTLLNKIFGL